MPPDFSNIFGTFCLIHRLLLPMEAWLAELEMEADEAPSLIHNTRYQYETMEATFGEQLSATLCENFTYPYSSENNISSPEEWDLVNVFIDSLETINDKNNNNNNEDDAFFGASKENKVDKEVNDSKKQGAKRKRQPNQVQDHIIAERRRRELLTQLFTSLCGLVPGLKKMDKTSILGEAIKYMKQLQENVKILEEMVANKKIESVVVIKKSQIVVNDVNGDDHNDNSSMEHEKGKDKCSGGNGGTGGGSRCVLNNVNDSFPEIEAKITRNKLLLSIYCEKQKGIMTKLFKELEKYDLSVTNCSVVPFENMTLDITIVAQMAGGFDMDVKDFVKNVHSVTQL